MDGGSAGEVLDLHPAGEARRDDDRVRIGLAQGGEESLFTDEARDFVVFLLVAEGAGHAAAAGVEVDDLGTGDATQQLERRTHADERALMAVALHEDALGARAEPEWASRERQRPE